MTQHILYNLASRNRPIRLYKVIDTITKLSADDNYTILVKVDNDDPNASLYTLDHPRVVWAWGTSESKVHAINRDIPTTPWDILVNVSDDTIFMHREFDTIIRHYCGPDDFLLFPEKFMETQIKRGWNERIAIMSIIGREYYDRDGYVYHPAYKSLWCDNEATDVARIRGRCKDVDVPIFYHAHPAAGYPTMDAQYKLTDSFYYTDKAVYEARKGEGFV
jgi:hypothetical protein